MFDTSPGPAAAMRDFYDFIVDNAALMTENVRLRFKEVNRMDVAVEAQIAGMEYLYQVVREDDLLPARDEALQVLGVMCMNTATANLWSRGDRALEIAAWCAGELGAVPEGAPIHPGPDYDPNYSFYQEPELAPNTGV